MVHSHWLPTIALVAGLAAIPSSAQAQNVRLTLKDGRATLVATQASAREILAEWARVGQLRVVNADKLVGPPLTLQLTDVPERKALDTVLRAAAGYMAAPRSTLVAGASRFDRLIIMPTSTTSGGAVPVIAGSPGRGGAIYPQPAVSQPMETPAEMPEPMGDPSANVSPAFMERPPETQFDYANPQLMQQQLQQMREAQSQGTPTGGTPNPAPSFFPSSFSPAASSAPAPTQPTATPSASQTTLRPGEVVPVPQQQPQFRNPYGIPGDVAPGSVAPPADLEPDRSKYLNPYQPTPAQTPEE